MFLLYVDGVVDIEEEVDGDDEHDDVDAIYMYLYIDGIVIKGYTFNLAVAMTVSFVQYHYKYEPNWLPNVFMPRI